MSKTRDEILKELDEMIAYVKSKPRYEKLDELLVNNWERSKKLVK